MKVEHQPDPGEYTVELGASAATGKQRAPDCCSRFFCCCCIHLGPVGQRIYHWKLWQKLLLFIPLGIIVLALLAFLALVIYAKAASYGPDSTAISALQSNLNVTAFTGVTGGTWLVFVPTPLVNTTAAAKGLILYPGGFVNAYAYAPIASHIAAATSAVVVITPFFLEAAIFGWGKSSDVVSYFSSATLNGAIPPVKTWILGGHSLGGAFATYHLSNIGDGTPIKGFLGLAGAGFDISGLKIQGALLRGSNDMVYSADSAKKGATQLPSGSVIKEIAGGNHGQWGSYGPQKGDGTPTITPVQQWDVAADVVKQMLQKI
ncbi:hypothetical protein BJ742DRAFT_845068 [Cladochytrium replicatum]|nr:hypothetical protein BJ742DRAFT_845068 [Cladochytrium replicatum]